MANRLHSLNELAENLKDQHNGSAIQLINLAAEEELLEEENKLSKKIEDLAQKPYWLRSFFIDNGSTWEFIDSVREILMAHQALRLSLDKKKNTDARYNERAGSLKNTLTSVIDVIEKLEVAGTQHNIKNLKSLETSILQLETNSKQVEKFVEKSAFTRFIGAISKIVGWTALAIGFATLNIGVMILGGINIYLADCLLRSTTKEKQAHHLNNSVNRFTGTICTLFKPAPKPNTEVSDNNLENDEALYPRIVVCKA